MRTEYSRQLKDLSQKLNEMGQFLIEQIEGAFSCFQNRNKKKAKMIIAKDQVCNEKQKEIEQLALSLLVLQQPVAADLRQISSSLKVITDLERMGDQAADIAEIVLDMGTEPIEKLEKTLKIMYTQTMALVINTMHSFEQLDSDKVISIMDQDDQIDALFNDVKDQTLEVIRKNVETGHDALDYFIAAKHLEKIGDYAVHILRWMYYFQEGIVPDKPESSIKD